MKGSILFLLFVPVLILFHPVQSWSAGQTPVNGTFKGNGKDAKLAYAVATPSDPFSGEETVEVVLTEQDPSAEAKPATKALFGKFGSALVLKITKSGDLIGCDIAHQALSTKPISTSGRVNISDFNLTGDTVSGKVATKGPNKIFDDTVDVNLTFQAKLKK